MDQQSRPKYVRVVIYLAESEHRALKTKLALKHVSVSEWVRRKVARFLDKKD